jgi:CRP-like cAMP-binding protein
MTSFGPFGDERLRDTLVLPLNGRMLMSTIQVKNHVLRRLTAEAFEALEPHLVRVPIVLKQELITPDVPISHVYFPESGLISIIAGSDSSELIECGHVGFEGMTDHVVAPGDTSVLKCLVQAPGFAWAVETLDYVNWIQERPTAQLVVLRYNQAFNVQVAYTALSHGSYTIDERLARWMLMSFDRTEDGDLPFVHSFISMMLGVRRSGVTTAIHRLEGEHAIRATRGHIKLRDREKLVELASGSYGTPESEYLRLMGPLLRD